jgi:hypothetical protein
LVDDQLEKKLKHKIDIQEMRVKVKQLALEETRERSSNASAAAPKTTKKLLAMGLDNKKELATHNALLKKQQKKNDDARAALKKELKKRDTVEPWYAATNFRSEWRDGAVHIHG